MEFLASGRTADVYAIDEYRVLRRYRDGYPVAAEAAVMEYVGGLGYPVPKVFAASGADLDMERVTGPTLVEAIVAGEVDLTEAVRILADLHARLHALPGRSDPELRVLHLDLHAENIVMSPHGPIVIDWRNATDGPPGLDVAMTALIMAEVAVDPDHPVRLAAGAAVALFVPAAGGVAADLLDRAVAMRAANPTLSGAEKDRLARAAALIPAA
jgi:streptomycin 6-kinase